MKRPEIPTGKYGIDDRRNDPPYSKEQYDPAQLKRGIEVEKEHADLYKYVKSIYPDFKMSLDEFAEWIAKAHLRELKDYYSRLDKMEAEGEAEEGD